MTKKTLKETLQGGLKLIPAEWKLTAVGSNKQPIHKGWQTAKSTIDQIHADIESGRAKGYGLMFGEASSHHDGSFLLGVDFDGPGTFELATEMNGGEPLPESVAWTSGKPDRHQRLYRVPMDYWQELAGKREFATADGHKFELRYNGHQSVLPPSVHPETGAYTWITPPKVQGDAWDDWTITKIAWAPQWMIDALLIDQREPAQIISRGGAAATGDRDWAIEYMEAIVSGYPSDDYQDWIRVGIALKSVADDLYSLWDMWSSRAANYDGNTQKRWDGFKPRLNGIAVLGWFAKKAGWQPKAKNAGLEAELRPISTPPELLKAETKYQTLEQQIEDVAAKEAELQDELSEITEQFIEAQAQLTVPGSDFYTTELKIAQLQNQKIIIADRLRLVEKRGKNLRSDRANKRVEVGRLSRKAKSSDNESKTGFAKDIAVIKAEVASHLSYDVLKKVISYDSEPVEFKSACLWLTDVTGHTNWNKGDTALADVLTDLAKRNEFCPVKNYLDSISAEVDHNFIDQCVPFLFGVNNPLVVATFKAQLIGSVKRIYDPGCHHRIMPIIYGTQKIGKSTFLRNLYGEFISEGDLPMKDKDGAMIIQRCWSHEIAECDTLFRTREASSLKSFVSLTHDTFRAPFDRFIGKHARRAVLWGTTNHKDLFTDVTGNTRYPVISLPAGWQIPTDWVKENRDNLWAAAINAYRSGIPNEIPRELEDLMAADSSDYTDKDALFDPVQELLARQFDSISLIEVGEALGFYKANFSKGDQNRITAIMRCLGWDSQRVDYCGQRVRRWVRPEQ